MATEFEKSVNSFQAKIDAKREALDKKAFEIKTYLNYLWCTLSRTYHRLNPT